MCTNSEKSWRLILALYLEPFDSYLRFTWLHVLPTLFARHQVLWCSSLQLQRQKPLPFSMTDFQANEVVRVVELTCSCYTKINWCM